MTAPTVRTARFSELDVATLYALLKLRVDVFVVEQECPYPELDGRDLEPETLHLWYADDTGTPAAYMRILRDPDGTARIGRLAVSNAARGTGLAGRLMLAGLEVVGDGPCILEAQSYLVGFYTRYGFTATGPEFDLDGIPHVPMQRSPS